MLRPCLVGSGVILSATFESIDVGESAGKVPPSRHFALYTNETQIGKRGWRPDTDLLATRKTVKNKCLYMGERKGQSRAWQYPFPSNDIEERKKPHTRTGTRNVSFVSCIQAIHLKSIVVPTFVQVIQGRHYSGWCTYDKFKAECDNFKLTHKFVVTPQIQTHVQEISFWRIYV